MSGQNLRVMTYNIRHGRGLDDRVDVERIARVILEADADLVALQEVDCGVERSGKVDMMSKLSELTGMAYAFGKNLDYQGGEYGNGVLSRFPILCAQNLRYRMIRPGEQRGLLHVVVEIDGGELAFISTHIDYRPDDAERLMNIEEIYEAAQSCAPRPVIVCGDFNAPPGSRAIALMKRDFFDVWELAGNPAGGTFPATDGTKRIDYIFVSRHRQEKIVPVGQLSLRNMSPALEATKARVIHSNASDHLPVVAELRMRE
jgi:endonuclease/exonuclease/phosphatase family metal-dependent hydrolase